MRAEADDLLAFLGEPGREWLTAQRPGHEFECHSRSLDPNAPVDQLQRWVLGLLEQGLDDWRTLPPKGEPRPMTWSRVPFWRVGLDDFEAFKQWRCHVTDAAKRIVSDAAARSR
jgi:hypothetical protein